MGRARGSNATMHLAFEAGNAYGTPPAAGANAFTKVPFVSTNIGAERGLIESNLLGQGREPQDPTQDVTVNDGDIVVPVDWRNIGLWLKLLFGAAVVTGAAAKASGTLTFSAQPAANSTVTIAGVAFTFVAADPTGNQVLIGANLAATLTNLAAALTASQSAPVQAATYSASATVLTVTARSGGPIGNAISIAASGPSNAATSGAALAGGTLATHTFSSGALTLPSASIEVGHPGVPAFSTNYGARANQLKISLSKQGLLDATISLICKGETDPVAASAAGQVSQLATSRFAQATGQVTKDGAALGSVVSADFTFSNGLEKVDTIRPDGEIEDVDPGMIGMSGSISVRYADLVLANAAVTTPPTPISLTFGWAASGFSLLFTVNRVFLPKVKRPIQGPNGVIVQYNWQASGQAGASLIAALTTDVPAF